MKRLGFSILIVLLAGLISGLTHAEGMRELMTLTIPFDFVAGNTSFPAGEYYVLGGPDQSLIWIKDLNAKKTAIVSTIPSISLEASTNSGLQFHRYGDTYFLYKVVLAGKDVSKVVGKSTREREIQLASGKATITTVLTADTATKR